eukprot:gene12247-biopygen3423
MDQSSSKCHEMQKKGIGISYLLAIIPMSFPRVATSPPGAHRVEPPPQRGRQRARRGAEYSTLSKTGWAGSKFGLRGGEAEMGVTMLTTMCSWARAPAVYTV